MLSAAFLDRLPSSVRPRFAALDDLEGRLVALAEAAGTDTGVSPSELVGAVAARVRDDDGEAPADALASFRPRDIALAVGAARGTALALAAFDREHRREIDRAIEKSPSLGLAVDEFRQLILQKLFVAPAGEAPKVASYLGRAPLSAWVRVTCARAVIDLARRADDAARPVDDDWLASLPDTDDPALRVLRDRYAPLLPAAFAEAVRQLSPRERNLLRQRFVHDIPAQALANAYGVHRATVFAWVEDARKKLLSAIRASLRTTVERASLESVVEVMGSALDVSIRRLLDSRLEAE